LAVSGPTAKADIDDVVRLDADCVVYMAAEPSVPPTTAGTDGWAQR
jgi:2,4-diaminopentanoate dehydrogenase